MDGRDGMEAAAPLAKRLTSEEFFALFPDEDGVRRELIGGEVFVTPTPIVRHQILVQRLGLSIARHLEAYPSQGEVFFVPLDVVMSPSDVVEPDIQVILGDQSEILGEKNVQGTPALVVEILSPSTRKRDLTIKSQLYEREGVREYWIVDPKRSSIVVRRRSPAGALTQVDMLDGSSGQVLQTPLLPGWSLELASFFR